MRTTIAKTQSADHSPMRLHSPETLFFCQIPESNLKKIDIFRQLINRKTAKIQSINQSINQLTEQASKQRAINQSINHLPIICATGYSRETGWMAE
jgi:hypothetical protein